MKNINAAELLFFTKNTAKIINKLSDAFNFGKISHEDLIQKLKALQQGINRKFDFLEKGDPIGPSDNLEDLFVEFLEQKRIVEPKNEFFKGVFTKEQQIREGNLEILDKFCASNKTILKDIKSDLQNKLITQKFINLILENKKKNAIEFIRKNKIPPEKIRKWFRLLIDTPAKYKNELDEQIDQLCAEFRRISFYSKGIPPQTRLTNRILAGIIALNNVHCAKGSKKDDCPTCLSWIQDLAKKLPYAKRSNTFLRCIGCNQEINELNQALVYESRWIYSEKYLKNCGYIVFCKKTGNYYEKEPSIVYFL